MYINISAKELLALYNAQAKLQALESGGVDNWEWYSESIDSCQEITKLPEMGLNWEIKYNAGDRVFYNNTSCEFVAYVSKKFAVVEIELKPDFDIDTSNHCEGCLIGDSDNKIQCRCEDVENLLEDIESNTTATFIPIIVQVKKLHDKPILIQKHEEEVEKLEQHKETVRTSTKELLLKKVALAAEIQKLEEQKQGFEELDNI